MHTLRASLRFTFCVLRFTLYVLLTTTCTFPTVPGFVRVEGTQFVRDGRPVRFVGANANHIWESAHFDAARILDEARDSGIGLIRIHLYGAQFYPFDRRPNDLVEIEEYWTHLDRVLDRAAQRRLLVILAPTWDHVGLIVFGDPRRGTEGHYLFMSEPRHVEQYQRFWTYLLDRKNTVNGRIYKHDPTIFGYNVINEWEVADHPKGRDAIETRYDVARWYEQIAGHIKRTAPNQLVGTGMIGDAQPGSDFLLQSAVKSIDFATVHAYDHQRPPEWLTDRARLAHEVLGKPIILQEGNAKGNDAAKAAYLRRYWEAAFAAEYNAVLFWDWQTSRDGYEVYPSDRETVQTIKEFARRAR